MISLALDTETVAEDARPQRLVCVSYATDGDSGVLVGQDGLALLTEAADDPEIELVLHNAPFDFLVFVKAGLPIEKVFELYSAGRVYDTMFAAMLRDLAQGRYEGTRKGLYTLGGLSQRFLGIELDKDPEVRLSYGPLLGRSLSEYSERQIAYARADATSTLGLRRILGDPPDALRQAAHGWWLELLSAQGMPTNPKTVEDLMNRTIAEMQAILPTLPAGWIYFDRKDGSLHRKTGDVQKYAFSIGVRSPTDAAKKRTPKGEVPLASNPKEVSLSWSSCEESGDEKLKAYARFNACFDVINKDLECLRHPYVRPRYGLAETGRTTSFGCYDGDLYSANLQNQKVEGGVRECFEAPEGSVFAIADFKGLELSTWAQVCYSLLGRSALREELNAGIDAHVTIASEILGLSYEDALHRCENKADREAYLARQVGKVVNFGCPGGLGVDSLVTYAYSNYEVKLTKEEAARHRALWYRLRPEAWEYFKYIKDLGDDEPFAHLFSGRLRGGTWFTNRANSFFQGLGGDAAKAAGWALSEACYAKRSSPLYGCRPCGFVHDEFILLVPESRAHECMIEQDRIMVAAAKTFIPDVRVSTEYVVSKVWSKKAKLLRNEEGRIIPWYPKAA